MNDLFTLLAHTNKDIAHFAYNYGDKINISPSYLYLNTPSESKEICKEMNNIFGFDIEHTYVLKVFKKNNIDEYSELLIDVINDEDTTFDDKQKYDQFIELSKKHDKFWYDHGVIMFNIYLNIIQFEDMHGGMMQDMYDPVINRLTINTMGNSNIGTYKDVNINDFNEIVVNHTNINVLENNIPYRDFEILNEMLLWENEPVMHTKMTFNNMIRSRDTHIDLTLVRSIIRIMFIYSLDRSTKFRVVYEDGMTTNDIYNKLTNYYKLKNFKIYIKYVHPTSRQLKSIYVPNNKMSLMTFIRGFDETYNAIYIKFDSFRTP